MTDGTTGIHVAPVTEDEAMNLASMFRKAADAVVQASTFPKQVADLESRVNDLATQLDRKTMHAEELDRSLHEVREQRDIARDELSSTQTELWSAQRNASELDRIVHEQQNAMERLNHDLDTTKAERDNYGLRAMQLEDELAAARAALADIQAKVAVFFPTPKPESVVEQAKPAEPMPNPIPEAVSHSTEPSPATGTEQVSAQPAPAAEPEVDFTKPHHWDVLNSRWVNDPEPEPTKPNDEIPF